MLCPVRGTWIAADVVADRRLAGRERFERVRAAIRRTLQVEERPHDLERIWTRAGVRDERQAPRDVLAQPDPGEKKPSFIDGNPAGALEQRRGVAFADDQLVDVAQHRVGSIELPDVMFGLRSLGHVDVTPDHPRGRAGRVAIQLAARIHPAPRSVLVPHPELDFVRCLPGGPDTIRGEPASADDRLDGGGRAIPRSRCRSRVPRSRADASTRAKRRWTRNGDPSPRSRRSTPAPQAAAARCFRAAPLHAPCDR